ncbi:2,3-bisphosphoglycerate-dependent phosphoglycerate mutase [Candidatus Nasuia deltocephalinicola str. NAS-ALF]|uniref:2,3-bisphosphoglycerate-dependent phosphoglycerate mutase n=1 Tax=Candidatus Nasuia deltocephalinicola str. NAS-ALF TaxID=1343077 RepID=S5SY39_9PROT|nr:2,3-bisphosphoglycerate-dependent phosphoglycerate mutase [Candidatus Nasuia deltocephalinicola str. NAS-ALF]
MLKLILLRHGESLGNLDNRFTGILDVDLTEKGYLDSYKCGIKLKKLEHDFDICYTSNLKRAIKTCWAVFDALNKNYIKLIKIKNLNERNYGKILGMNKIESVLKFKKKNVDNWLNMYNYKPPKTDILNKYWKTFQKKYILKKIKLNSESLDDISKRVLIFWEKVLKKSIYKKKILIVAHSNILKVLINYIEKKKINNIIENSKVIVYEFNNKLEVIKKNLI